MKNIQPISVGAIAKIINSETIVGDESLEVTSIASLTSARASSISFCVPSKRSQLKQTLAGVIITNAETQSQVDPSKTVLIHSEPTAAINRLMMFLFPDAQARLSQARHQSALIAKSASIADTAIIDARVVIGENVVIGESVWVKAGAVIESDVSIGDHSIIGQNAVIETSVKIGKSCVVGACSVIGARGFGYVMDDGQLLPTSHLGSVVMHDGAEVGSHASVCRGVLDDTVIGEHSKIDSHVHLAHNVVLGRYGFIAACSGIAGTVSIGDRFRIGGMTGIAGHLTIADDVSIAGGSGVNKSITEPGMYVGVIPAMPIRDWTKLTMALKSLTKTRHRQNQL